MTRNAQDIIDDMRNIVKPRIAKMLLKANFEGCGKEDKAEFETEFEIILTLAEKALEQEPCDDCISRQAMHIELEKWITYGEYKYSNATKYLYDRIDRLPSVSPQQKVEKWIPVN